MSNARPPHSAPLKLLKLLAAGLALAVAACGAPVEQRPGYPGTFMLAPASPEAGRINDLTWLLHGIMTVVFVGVLTAALVIYRRYRARAADQRGRQIFGNTRLEVIWTALPGLVLIFAFAISTSVMCDVQPAARAVSAEAIRVRVVGHQWWWEYSLPDQGAVTANELHLPAGQLAVLELVSADVMHNWWVPQLQGKLYNIPGHQNTLSFTPAEVGTFGGACGEFCGLQHAWMRTRVVVEPPDRFTAWAQEQAAPAREPGTDLARRGQALFQSSTCSSCHYVRGAAGPVGQEAGQALAGPDLTHVAARATLGAGVVENTPENLARWIRAPQELKPGNLMPSLRLTDDEVAALTAYLSELR